MLPLQVSELYYSLHADTRNELFDSERTEHGHRLDKLLQFVDHDPVFEGDDGPFRTYPNVLNNCGTGRCCALAAGSAACLEDQCIFRDLPNGGRRSPRSTLFCHMASQNSLPYVHALARAEFCTNPALAQEQENDYICSIFDDDLPSDLEVANDIHDADFLFEGSWEENCELLAAFSDGTSISKTALHGDPFFSQDSLRVDLLENFLEKFHFVGSAEELQQFLYAHMAAGGSLNAAAVTARLSEFEDKFLADEAKEEAAADRRFALLRLKEATIQCVMLLPRYIMLFCNGFRVSFSAKNAQKVRIGTWKICEK